MHKQLLFFLLIINESVVDKVGNTKNEGIQSSNTVENSNIINKIIFHNNTLSFARFRQIIVNLNS